MNDKESNSLENKRMKDLQNLLTQTIQILARIQSEISRRKDELRVFEIDDIEKWIDDQARNFSEMNSFTPNLDNSHKSKDYLHFPIKLFGMLDPNLDVFVQVEIISLFKLAETLSKSKSERLGENQLRKQFFDEHADSMYWCHPENDDHFYFFRANSIVGVFDLTRGDFEFDYWQKVYRSCAVSSRITTVHKSILEKYRRENRKNSEFDFRILAAIRSILGRDRPYRYIPSFWLRYGFFGVTAKASEFESKLPTKKRVLDSVNRLEREDLIVKVTSKNKSYFSVRLNREQLKWKVAEKMADKDLRFRRKQDEEDIDRMTAAILRKRGKIDS